MKQDNNKKKRAKKKKKRKIVWNQKTGGGYNNSKTQRQAVAAIPFFCFSFHFFSFFFFFYRLPRADDSNLPLKNFSSFFDRDFLLSRKWVQTLFRLYIGWFLMLFDFRFVSCRIRSNSSLGLNRNATGFDGNALESDKRRNDETTRRRHFETTERRKRKGRDLFSRRMR